MASSRQVLVAILGDAKSFSKAVDGAINDTDKMSGGFTKFGKIAAAGAAAGAVALGAFAAKSADTFARVGGEVAKLTRYTGATAEEASRLRFAGAQAGLGVDDLTKSLGLLSKNVVGTKLDKLGFDFKDASGKARPLNDDLLKIADRFQSMPNGAEKTALAMQLFGKSGAAMIPFLNRGAEGIAELEKQSDKFGNTLSGKDLEAVKASTAQHRLFSAAMDGLQIQVGRYVLPVFTKFATFLAGNMPAAINVVRSVVEKLASVFDRIGAVVAPVLDRIRIGWEQFQAAFLYGADDFISKGDGLSNFILEFGDATRKVFDFLKEHTTAVLVGLGAALLALTSPIAAVVAGLVYAYTNFQAFHDVVNAVVQFLIGTVVPMVAAFVASVIGSFSDLVAATQERWAAISEAVSHVVNVIRDIVTVAVNVIAALWRAWGDDLLNITTTIFGAIGESIANVVQVIKGIIDLFLAVINGDWGAAWTAIKEIVAGVWAEIQNEISTVLSIIQSILGGVMSTIQQVWAGVWGVMGGAVTGAWSTIKGAVSGGVEAVMGFITAMPGRISGAAHGMWDGIASAFKSAINSIIKGWNAIEFKVPGFSVGPVHFGGFTLGLPDVPTLHTGGIYRSPGASGEGLALLRDREGVFTPEQMAAMGNKGGGDTHLHFAEGATFYGMDPRAMGDEVQWLAASKLALFRVAA